MKNLFRNQWGFSMVQGMVLAGVVAGSSLVATRMLTDQKLAQKSAESRDKLEDLHNLIQAALQNRENCQATILNNMSSTAANSLASTRTGSLTTIIIKNGTTPIARVYDGTRSTVYMNNSITVERMNIQPDPTDPTNARARLAVIYNRLESNDATKRTGQGVGGKRITKYIPIRIQRYPFATNLDGVMVAAGTFESCHALTQADTNEGGNEAMLRRMCGDLGAVTSAGTTQTNGFFRWDESSQRCVANATCPTTQVYVGVDSMGRVMCRDLRNWIDYNAVIDSTPTNNCLIGAPVRFEIVGTGDSARVRVRCN
jgi:hypothetical protein